MHQGQKHHDDSDDTALKHVIIPVIFKKLFLKGQSFSKKAFLVTGPALVLPGAITGRYSVLSPEA
jgi:hypothetical protein